MSLIKTMNPDLIRPRNRPPTKQTHREWEKSNPIINHSFPVLSPTNHPNVCSAQHQSTTPSHHHSYHSSLIGLICSPFDLNHPRFSLSSPVPHPLELPHPSSTLSSSNHPNHPNHPIHSPSTHPHPHHRSLSSQPISCHVRPKSNRFPNISLSTHHERMDIMVGLGIVAVPRVSIALTSDPLRNSHQTSQNAHLISQTLQKCHKQLTIPALPPYGSHAPTPNSMDGARIAGLFDSEGKSLASASPVISESSIPTPTVLPLSSQDHRYSHACSPSMPLHKSYLAPAASLSCESTAFYSGANLTNTVDSFNSPTTTLLPDKTSSPTSPASLSNLGFPNRKLNGSNFSLVASNTGLRSGVPAPVSVLNLSEPTRMTLAGDLSRVKEEDEDEDVGENFKPNPIKNLGLPNPMETVIEVEEEVNYQSQINSLFPHSETTEEICDDNVSIPPSFQDHTHSQPCNFHCIHPTAQKSHPSRQRPKSLFLLPSPRLSSPHCSVSLPLPATQPSCFNPHISRDTSSQLAITFTPPSLKPSSLVSQVYSKASSLFTSLDSPASSPSIRCLSYSPSSSGNSTLSLSLSTARSSLSSLDGSFATKLAWNGKTSSGLDRRSVSYSKTYSPKPESRFKFRLSLSSRTLHNSLDDGIITDSLASACSFVVSETSNQAERFYAQQARKKRFIQSLENQEEQILLNQSQVIKLPISKKGINSEVIAVFGDLVMENSSQEVVEEFDKIQSLLEHSRPGPEGRVKELTTPSDTLARQLDASRPITRNPYLDRLKAEVYHWKQRSKELEFERDELAKEAKGCKVRIMHLEEQLKLESAKATEHHREMREKDKLIVELLKQRDESSENQSVPPSGVSSTAISKPNLPASNPGGFSATDPNRSLERRMAAEELTVAQTKLINELSNQMFDLASALAQEQTNHMATKKALQDVAMQIEVNAIDEEDPALTTFTDEESSPIESTFPGDYLKADVGNHLSSSSIPETQTPSAYSIKVPHSLIQTPVPSNTKFSIPKTQPSPLEHSSSLPRPTVNTTPDPASSRVQSGFHKDSSKISAQVTASKHQSHHRSASFVQRWRFPKGPVLPSPNRVDDPEDRCFFFKPDFLNNTLPPVQPNSELIDFQPFFHSKLQFEDDDQIEGTTNLLVPSSFKNPTSADLFKGPKILSDDIQEKEKLEGSVGCAQDGKYSSSIGAPDSHHPWRSYKHTVDSQDPSQVQTTKLGNVYSQSGGSKTQLSLQNLSGWLGAYVGGLMSKQEDLAFEQGFARPASCSQDYEFCDDDANISHTGKIVGNSTLCAHQ